MSTDTITEQPEAKSGGLLQRLLDFIERVGNKVPHPAILFLALCIGVIVLSQILAWAGVGATYEVVTPNPQTIHAVGIGGSVLPGETMPSQPPGRTTITWSPRR